jgi:hypothetical protein
VLVIVLFTETLIAVQLQPNQNRHGKCRVGASQGNLLNHYSTVVGSSVSSYMDQSLDFCFETLSNLSDPHMICNCKDILDCFNQFCLSSVTELVSHDCSYFRCFRTWIVRNLHRGLGRGDSTMKARRLRCSA